MSNTETLLNALIAAGEADDKEAGIKAGVALAVSFMDTLERQAKAMESVAKSLAEQTELLKASLAGK